MASKRRLRRKTCGNKARYPSQEAALNAIKALFRARGFQGYLAPYRCPFCNAFHYGHPPRQVRQAIAGYHA